MQANILAFTLSHAGYWGKENTQQGKQSKEKPSPPFSKHWTQTSLKQEKAPKVI